MIPYILHASFITGICFLFYKLFLQKETFYRLNRWLLISCLAVSFLLPLLPIPQEWSWRSSYKEALSRLFHTGKTPIRPDTKQNTTLPTGEIRPAQKESTDPGPLLLAQVGEQKTSQPKEQILAPSPVYPPEGTVQTASGLQRETGYVRATSGLQAKVQQTRKEMKTKITQHRILPTVQPKNKVQRAGTVTGGSSQTTAGAKPQTITAASTPTTTRASIRTSMGTRIATGFPIAQFLHWLYKVYLLGLIFFGVSFLLQVAVLLYQSYRNPVIRDGRFRIIEVSGDRAPCSFGNNIFINPSHYDWETYNQILIHEKIHVSGRHTFDIVLAEIGVVLQWFNPFAWLYRKEVENNLEFLTDQSVLSHKEVERSAYQLSLLRVSAPHLLFSITNNYNQSLLKRRIVMMNTQRSPLQTVWKYFFLLPLLTILAFALNKPAAFGQAAPVAPIAAKASMSAPLPPAKASFPDAYGLVPSTSGVVAPAATGLVPASSLIEPAFLSNASMGLLPDTTVRPGATSAAHGTMPAPQAPAVPATATSSAKAPISIDPSDITTVTTTAYAQAVVDPQVSVSVSRSAYTAVAPVSVNVNQTVSVSANVDVAPFVNISKNDSDIDRTEGSWFITTQNDEKLDIDLRNSKDGNSWESSFTVDKSEITPFPGQGSVTFKLVREAGTILFDGQFDGKQGFGHYKFTADPSYMNALKQAGVEELEDRLSFSFFVRNIKKDYVVMLHNNGYTHLTGRDIGRLSAMHVDEAYISSLKGADIQDFDPVKDLVSLKTQHVDRAYIDEMKTISSDRLSTRDLVSLKVHRIDKAYVDEMKAAGYDHLSIRDLISLKIQHVDGQYVRGLGASKGTVPVSELISYKVLNIDSGYISSLHKVGYDNLNRNELASMHNQNVTAEFIKSFQDAGYRNIPARDLIALKSREVTPEFVKGFRDMGYGDIDVRELISLKSMGITPDYVKEFNKIGFDHIPVRMLTSLKSTGVNADYISKMKEKGFNSPDLQKYIRLKNDFN